MIRTARRHWESLSDSALLDTRLCDLRLSLADSWLQAPIEQLNTRLLERGLLVKPDYWLSDEWMTPDDVNGMGIPFYLMHPRLMRLERRFMLEVEGGNLQSAVRLLRHEMGHVVCNAYRLHRRPRWRRVFGSPSTPYPRTYEPDPTRRDFVQHLDDWYAQCHPDEDWAETFAVWLSPKSNWRRRYADWPALDKLEYVDSLMSELSGVKPSSRRRIRPYSLPQLRSTVRQYYQHKQARYGLRFPAALEPALQSVFDASPHKGQSAARFLRQHKHTILRVAGRCSKPGQPVPPRVLDAMIVRSTELGLRATVLSAQLERQCASLAVMCAEHMLSEASATKRAGAGPALGDGVFAV